MKKIKTHPGEVDDLFLIEIHETEEEIDRFAASKKREAEGIISDAAAKARNSIIRGQESAAEEAAALRERLLEEARERAEEIILEGKKHADREGAGLSARTKETMSLIMKYILGSA